MPSVRDDLNTIVAWWRRPKSRGVTVFTGLDAEFYRTATRWRRDEKGVLDVLDWRGQLIATYLPNTWMRVEAGPPGVSPPHIPPIRAE